MSILLSINLLFLALKDWIYIFFKYYIMSSYGLRGTTVQNFSFLWSTISEIQYSASEWYLAFILYNNFQISVQMFLFPLASNLREIIIVKVFIILIMGYYITHIEIMH